MCYCTNERKGFCQQRDERDGEKGKRGVGERPNLGAGGFVTCWASGVLGQVDYFCSSEREQRS